MDMGFVNRVGSTHYSTKNKKAKQGLNGFKWLELECCLNYFHN